MNREMLERVLEPEYMDTHEEATDYDSMDHSAVNETFVKDLLLSDFFAKKPVALDVDYEADSKDILDLGTGTALIPIALCMAEKNVRVMAVDMAVHMLDIARYNIEVASLTDRIELMQTDAKGLDFEADAFDVVISNSIIHHIPDPIVCLREAVRVTKPGGMLFFRDLMRPTTSEKVTELVALYAGNENEHQQQMFDDSLRAALSLNEMQSLVEDLGFEKKTVIATSDRHWTWIGEKAG